MTPHELAQSDVNRIATLAMRDNLQSLLRIADKLYRRNPAEWRKTGLPTREAALARLRDAIESQPLLLADKISAQERNLSFEREFGKVIGRLDLLSAVLTEKYRRAVISYAQSLLGGSFLQFLPVR